MADEEKNTAPEAEETGKIEAEKEATSQEETTPNEAVEAAPVVAVAKPEEIEPGMVVRVHQKIKETNTKGEERERIQIFEGTVIAVKGKDRQSRTITVRKIASGVGVERIFPVRSPAIAKIETVKQYKVRRAKLYFLRTYKKRLTEKVAKKK